MKTPGGEAGRFVLDGGIRRRSCRNLLHRRSVGGIKVSAGAFELATENPRNAFVGRRLVTFTAHHLNGSAEVGRRDKGVTRPIEFYDRFWRGAGLAPRRLYAGISHYRIISCGFG